MDKTRLWAKSGRRYDPIRRSMYLGQHLIDVRDSAHRVVEATGDAQLQALGLSTRHHERLKRCVLLAAALHDLGKANDHFQAMILRTRDIRVNPQGIRHEWVTVLLMKEMKTWLLPAVSGAELDFAFVEWAIAGHHPAHNHASPPRIYPPGAGVEVRLHTDHPDFSSILDWLEASFSLGSKPSIQRRAYSLIGSNNVYQQLSRWAREAQRVWDSGPSKSEDAKFLAALKNTLIAADVAGSALPKEGEPDWGSISEAFTNLPDPSDLDAVVIKRLGGHSPRSFQQCVADSTAPVTYVKAGCGTGKTLAAYLWAAKNHPQRRLYFCYPTTGTATEGYKDYLYETDGELGDIEARLFHSRSRVDHEIILTTAADVSSPEAEAADRADALEAWSTPIVSCTVDTVLGLVQNNRRGLFAWPALAQSAFVFDEIHAYDDRLFGALLRFLRDLPGLPALLMTASLPSRREAALREVLTRNRMINLQAIEGPGELEALPRYHKQIVRSNELLDLITQEIERGGKVLWVSNTVNRVMESAEITTSIGLHPLIYHSRFKYIDRVQRHKAVVEAFTPERKQGILACTSQVCEMSLDLKGCTLLVTEVAPVPALIQRLGRLNRHASQGDPTRPFVVLPLDSQSYLPYTPDELDAAMRWMQRLPDSSISQRLLADAWEQTSDNPPALIQSAWLDGGPVTTITELREASPGITVIMEDDVARIEKAGDLGKYTLPMPAPRQEWRSWPRIRGIPVAPAGVIYYEPKRGARWRNA